MSMDAFASLVRRGRETSGLSYQRIAELVGRSPATIRDWERGKTTPRDPEVVLAVAAVLDIPEDELLQSAGLSRPAVEPVASYSDLAPHPDEEAAEMDETSAAVGEPSISPPTDEPEGEEPIDVDIPLWVQSIHEDVSRAETTDTEAPEDDEGQAETTDTEAPLPDEGQAEGPQVQQLEPPTHRTAIPPQLAPRPPAPVPSELSYLEDDRELTTYRLRAVITVVVGVVLVVILEWAFHGLGVSLKSALSGVHP